MTSPAFRRKLEALPDDSYANASVVGDASSRSSPSRSPDSEDAAAAFKARALAFASLRSTADEQTAMGGLIEALAALAAGERVLFSSRGDGERKTKTKTKTNPKVDQDLTRVPIEPAFSRCLDAVLEILFLPNARPLHRAIVTAPRAFPPRARVVAERALADALRVRIKTARSATNTWSGAARLRVLGVLFSVASCQPQTAAERRVVRAVAVEAAALIGEGATFFFLRADQTRTPLLFVFLTPFGARLFFSLLEGLPSKEGPSSRLSARAARRRRFPKTSRFERDEFSFQKLELPSQARTFGAMEPGPLGAVANGFTDSNRRSSLSFWFFLLRKSSSFALGRSDRRASRSRARSPPRACYP